jgi:hypothetical protein
MKSNLVYLGFIIFFLSSCGMNDFAEQSELGNLKVLALVADTPEINAAATVTITPLISYPDGGDTTLNYSWQACPDPGIDFGAELNCDSSSLLTLSDAGTFATSALSSTNYTGDATNISVNIPAGAFTYLATLSSDIQYNGLDYILFLTYTDPTNNSEVSALRRVKLTTKGASELNTNPSTGNILFDGADLSTYPTVTGDMTVATLSPSETYQLETSSGLKSFNEDMFISWYASSGEFQFNRTDIAESNEYSPGNGSGVFVIVYRDGRGGVATRLVNF